MVPLKKAGTGCLQQERLPTVRFGRGLCSRRGDWSDGEGAGLRGSETLVPYTTPGRPGTPAPRTKAAASKTTQTYPAKPHG